MTQAIAEHLEAVNAQAPQTPRASRKRPEARTISWSEFEPMLQDFCKTLSATNDEAMRAIGYAGATHFPGWKKEGRVPMLAVLAMKGFLAELGVKAATPEPIRVHTFDQDELAELFDLVRRTGLHEQRKHFLPKLAQLLAETE